MTWVICFLLIAILALLLFLQKNYLEKFLPELTSKFSDLRTEIRNSIQPEFINLSPSTEEWISIATEIWRFDQRVSKIQDSLSEAQERGFRSSIEKLNKLFSKQDIEIRGFTAQKFNEGLNVEVLSTDTDPSISETVIKETVEPMVLYRGKVVKKAKVILLTNGA